jgi:Glycosyl transferase family 2
LASDPLLAKANIIESKNRLMRHWAALAFTLAAMAALTRMGAAATFNAPLYAATLAGASAVTTGLLWKHPVLTGRAVLIGAALAHALTLFAIPDFIDDYFRFVWDGWRTLQVGTPYGAPPESFVVDDAVPLDLRAVLDRVNNPEYPTIYGPVLQFAFAAVFALFGTNPVGLKLLFAGVNLLLIALLLRRHPPGAVALYAWNPLVIADTSLHLHPDGLLAAALFAGLLAGRRHPIVVGVLFAAAAGVKLVALAAWPMLLRLRPAALLAALVSLSAFYLFFLLQGRGAGFETTAAFAQLWHFNPLVYEALLQLFDWQVARQLAFGCAAMVVLSLHARSRSFEEVPLTAVLGVILLFSPAINSWYLLWLLPFAVGRHQIWPFAATVALPFSYLTGLTLDDPALEPFEVHPLARLTEVTILVAAMVWDWHSHRCRRRHAGAAAALLTPIPEVKIAVVIPALNEEAAVGDVVTGVRAALGQHLDQLIVADNGSTDRTAQVASAAGATVVSEPERGYGAACLAALALVKPEAEIVLFVDSDGSDIVADAPKIIASLVEGSADLVIGSRVAAFIEPGAMTVPQRFGNWLAPLLVRLIWDVRYSDLGPFRAIRRDALERLSMQDRDFGWTIEMQVRAAKQGLRIVEVPTGYRRRIGISKISGTIRGVLLAGTKILFVIGREAFGDLGSKSEPQTSTVHHKTQID